MSSKATYHALKTDNEDLRKTNEDLQITIDDLRAQNADLKKQLEDLNENTVIMSMNDMKVRYEQLLLTSVTIDEYNELYTQNEINKSVISTIKHISQILKKDLEKLYISLHQTARTTAIDFANIMTLQSYTELIIKIINDYK